MKKKRRSSLRTDRDRRRRRRERENVRSKSGGGLRRDRRRIRGFVGTKGDNQERRKREEKNKGDLLSLIGTNLTCPGWREDWSSNPPSTQSTTEFATALITPRGELHPQPPGR